MWVLVNFTFVTYGLTLSRHIRTRHDQFRRRLVSIYLAFIVSSIHILTALSRTTSSESFPH